MALWVVTGADRGIGAALCRLLAARGDTPVAACLDNAPALRAQGIEVAKGIDVSCADAVQKLAVQLGERCVDVLVHNAGSVSESAFGALDYAAMQREYAINALGPLRVTEALLARMQRGGRIGIVSSRVGSLSENGSGGLWGYRMSKAAANMAGVNLAHALRPRGIAVRCLHPGSVRTQMTAGLTDQATVGTLIEPEDAARGLIARLDELSLDCTGEFRHANGQILPW